jgi:hypothetical protein
MVFFVTIAAGWWWSRPTWLLCLLYLLEHPLGTHWDDFLADEDNIWKAARYLAPSGGTAFDKIPPLTRSEGSTTEGKQDQAAELLRTFFPPLPTTIEDEGERPQRNAVNMPELTMEEVERCIYSAKPWKAPGGDGLPAMVWRQLWPVVKEQVLRLFRGSLDQGLLPTQWRNAKIIPLKKPSKRNYAVAKTWRPISLLPTLGKKLEAVIAERMSYVVEKHGLLPTNHFGGRKQRSTEQALLLLQERIYNAWRERCRDVKRWGETALHREAVAPKADCDDYSCFHKLDDFLLKPQSERNPTLLRYDDSEGSCDSLRRGGLECCWALLIPLTELKRSLNRSVLLTNLLHSLNNLPMLANLHCSLNSLIIPTELHCEHCSSYCAIFASTTPCSFLHNLLLFFRHLTPRVSLKSLPGIWILVEVATLKGREVVAHDGRLSEQREIAVWRTGL